MKNLDYKAISQINEKLYVLDQTTAIIDFMQTAVAEGGSVIDNQITADALYHVCCSQKEALEYIHGLIG